MKGRTKLRREQGDDRERIREQVRVRYGRVASKDGSPEACEAGIPAGTVVTCVGELARVASQMGYTSTELASLPAGTNLGLGCGNPTALLSLKLGQTVLDLGSGGGIDCFLAAKRVGSRGRVIGVDMTPEMLAKARKGARKGGYLNVEFRLGEIEHLPVADESVDVVISNCVINLAPDKGAVYREAFRALRPGGRLAVSDVVATRPISARERADPSLWSSCLSGALEMSEVKTLLKRAGFKGVRLTLKIPERAPNSLRGQASIGVVSADILAVKPKDTHRRSGDGPAPPYGRTRSRTG